MLKAGMKIGGSSDCPVANLDPRVGLRDAVLRRSPSGEIIGPQERLSMDEAIRLYTQGSAYLSFDEARNGSIEAGKRRILPLWPPIPGRSARKRFHRFPISMTVVGGEIVHSE